MRNFLDALFCGFRWYRKLTKAKWEYWWVDSPVCSDIWHRVTQFTDSTGPRPSGLCRAIHEKEDWSAND